LDCFNYVHTAAAVRAIRVLFIFVAQNASMEFEVEATNRISAGLVDHVVVLLVVLVLIIPKAVRTVLVPIVQDGSERVPFVRQYNDAQAYRTVLHSIVNM
jgi:hypothetical protein